MRAGFIFSFPCEINDALPMLLCYFLHPRCYEKLGGQSRTNYIFYPWIKGTYSQVMNVRDTSREYDYNCQCPGSRVRLDQSFLKPPEGFPMSSVKKPKFLCGYQAPLLDSVPLVFHQWSRNNIQNSKQHTVFCIWNSFLGCRYGWLLLLMIPNELLCFTASFWSSFLFTICKEEGKLIKVFS